MQVSSRCSRHTVALRTGLSRAAKDTHLVLRVLERERVPIAKPILEGYVRFPEVLLAQHVLVPHDELDDTQAVREREEDGEVEGRIYGDPRRVDRLLHYWRLVPVPQERYHDKSVCWL